MDTFFLSHGSPTLVIDEELAARHFLMSWQQKVFQSTPKAILVVSAHWETYHSAVNAVDRNETIYDFYGFPEPTYQLKYPAPGSPEVAKRVKELLTGAGYKSVREDKARGLDHAAWVPLILMYPQVDIPVCELSVQTKKDAEYHFNLGRALAPLRDEGVLIVGSGSATHNLRCLSFDGNIAPWATEFDSWLTDSLVNGRYDDVNHYLEKAPHAKTAHPSPDHFYPLHVALGAAGYDAKAELIHQSWSHGSLPYSSYRFTTLPRQPSVPPV